MAVRVQSVTIQSGQDRERVKKEWIPLASVSWDMVLYFLSFFFIFLIVGCRFLSSLHCQITVEELFQHHYWYSVGVFPSVVLMSPLYPLLYKCPDRGWPVSVFSCAKGLKRAYKALQSILPLTLSPRGEDVETTKRADKKRKCQSVFQHLKCGD